MAHESSSLKRALISPYIGLIFFAIAWGPLYVAEFISRRRPVDASRGDLEAFAFGWLIFTSLFSILGLAQLIVAATAWAVRFYRDWF
jgi:hypothetical protein